MLPIVLLAVVFPVLVIQSLARDDEPVAVPADLPPDRGERPSWSDAPVAGRSAGRGTRALVGDAMDLTDVPWRSATTGWQVLADRNVPIRDWSFTYGPMVVAGETFNRGLATYPFSEIVYHLDGPLFVFTARVGVTDDSNGVGSVQFFVYGDDALLYQSGTVRAGEPARDVDVEVAGSRTLRLLVDDAGDGSLGDYALWGDPTIAPVAVSAATSEEGDVFQSRAAEVQEAERRMAADDAALGRRAVTEKSLLAAVSGAGARAGFAADTSSALLANDQAGLIVGYGGPRNGRVTVLDRRTDLPTLVDVFPVLVTSDNLRLPLFALEPTQSRPDETRRLEARDGGPGTELVLHYRVPRREGASVRVSFVLHDEDAAVRIAIRTAHLPLRAVEYVSRDDGSFVVGGDVRYLTARSHLYQGEVHRDGHVRRAPFGATEPAIIWSEDDRRGLLVALVDYVPSPAWLSVRGQPGQRGVQLGVELTATLQDFGPDASSPPQLAIELVRGPLGPEVFRRYRDAMAALYPSPPRREAARFQWGSWYAHGPGVSASRFLDQLRLLTRGFGDLGRWQMQLDAGWYVQNGREDADLANVDTEKFPRGIGPVADEVHAAGMDLILYLGTGFVHDSRADGGEWLALTGLINKHPDWLIPFQTTPSGVRRYLLDYRKDEVREYLTNIVRDYFLVHRADGIFIDGLADAEGQLIPRVERDSASGPPYPLLPVLDVYRLIRETADTVRPDAFLIGSWLTPDAASPYMQIHLYADDSEHIDSPYPFPGFVQKLDYTLFSRLARGQEGYVGASIGDPLRPDARWWLQAAAALGTPALLSFDLARLNPATLAAFRADLRGVDPFSGVTRYGPGLFPDTFATTRDGVTYLGVVNREPYPRDVPVSLTTLGLDASGYTMLDMNSGEARHVTGEFAVSLPGRSLRSFVLRSGPGLLRTSSVDSERIEDADAGVVAVALSGPPDAPGFAHFVVPSGATVRLDGAVVTPVSSAASGTAGLARDAGAAGQHSYDESSGILTLRYSHSGRRVVEIRW